MKPKLIPLKVPWQISPSTPFWGLTIVEYQETRVSFVADLRSQNKEYYEGIVTVICAGADWIKVSPSIDEVTAVNEDEYDWSEVEFHNNVAGKDMDIWFHEFIDRWKSTGVCPYPRAYKVQNSEWLSSLPVSEADFTHLLFLGEEIYIEVITKSWRWEIKQKDELPDVEE